MYGHGHGHHRSFRGKLGGGHPRLADAQPFTPPLNDPGNPSPPGQGGSPPGQNPTPNPRQQLRQEMYDFVKGVYGQEGDAKLTDYIGTYADGAWTPPTGMPQGFADRVNNVMGRFADSRVGDKFNQFLGNYFTRIADKTVPDARLQKFIDRGPGRGFGFGMPMMPWGFGMGMGLWHGFGRGRHGR